MNQKVLLRRTVLFLAVFYLLSRVSAVPASRSLKMNEENPSSSLQDLLPQEEDGLELSEAFQMQGELVEHVEGRMDIETTDYPGTGANNHHDPRSPGRA